MQQVKQPFVKSLGKDLGKNFKEVCRDGKSSGKFHQKYAHCNVLTEAIIVISICGILKRSYPG